MSLASLTTPAADRALADLAKLEFALPNLTVAVQAKANRDLESRP